LGEPVRALVRDPDAASSLLGDEIELRLGDLANDASVRAAMRGATSMVLLTPHGPFMAAAQRRLIAFAREHGVRVVKLSGTSAGIRRDGPDACRQHWLVEQDLAQGHSPYVILRSAASLRPTGWWRRSRPMSSR
jgi:uncharacterized protein YbjT (DUF2867 family)